MTPQQHAAQIVTSRVVLLPEDTETIREEIAGAILQAILEERERCARMAESFGNHPSANMDAHNLCEIIADLIRAGVQP